MKQLYMLLAVLMFSACGIPADAGSTSQDGAALVPGAGFVEDSSGSSPTTNNSESNTSPLSQEDPALKITVGNYELLASFEDNRSAAAFRELLSQGPVTIEMDDYGGFEKVGPLGTELIRNDAQITAMPGDVILYQGNQITIYYGTNSWSFTRLASIDDPVGLQEKLGDGPVSITFSLA